MKRWWRRWRARRRPIDECVCGASLTAKQRHLLVSRPDDDETLGITGGGGTFMAAGFCAEHCPGGCDRGCVPSVA